MVFCDPDEQFWQSEKETDLMECALKSKRKGFKTVSTDDSFREYFKGSREMGTACSSIYVNYTSINQFKKKKADGQITDVANLSKLTLVPVEKNRKQFHHCP